MINALVALHEHLSERAENAGGLIYRIPSLWLPHGTGGRKGDVVATVDPYAFFRDRIGDILNHEDSTPPMLSSAGEWSRHAVIYNMFIRLTTAWDHDGDGHVSIEPVLGGFRETGTFLKAIILLPYLRRLGINTLYLLPVTSIGHDGNKGTLGSPYAIRNPYKLDSQLAEPWLDLGVDDEFAAFVEAAHRLGMRVVMEFVFRTASKDSEWASDHPNWFYWIDAAIPDRGPGVEHGYGNPHFTKDELQIISTRVKRNDTASLPPPGMDYRAMFTETPETIEMIDGRWIGTTDDGKHVRIPGAFADWPPDDVQPPWNDVTYLKLYDHPSFNYIAYNTIRVYDSRLQQVENENRGLWNTIINIIPHYQKTFSIDGVMIDMGHALPRRLKQSIVDRARKINPDFAFWEENFAISQKSRQEGYNATVGYLLFDEHDHRKVREFCTMLETHDVPVPFFATAENHNTPRAASRDGGMTFSRMAFTINAFLPAILFIHQGYELGETYPVNTGLGFSQDEIDALPAHLLPLFSESAIRWDNPEEMGELISTVNAIRAAWATVVTDPRHQTFQILPSSEENILAFLRTTFDRTSGIAIIANMNCHHKTKSHLPLSAFGAEKIVDAITGKTQHFRDGVLRVDLSPGQVLVLPLTNPPL